MATRCHSRSTGNTGWLQGRAWFAGKAKTGSRGSFCVSLDFPTGYSWDSSLPSLSREGEAGKPPMLENRGYHSPRSKFQFAGSVFAWEGRDVDGELLLRKAVASFTITSFCRTWQKLVLPPAHVPSGRNECPMVLFSTEERFCSCFKRNSYPFSFGPGIQA